MSHFTVVVGRNVRDYESVVVSVEAKTQAGAIRKALKTAREDDEFWSDAKRYYGGIFGKMKIDDCIEEAK